MAGIAAVAVTGYATYRIWDQGERDEQRPADAIVVMGAAQYDGRPSPVFAARLDHAIDLFQAGVAPTLIVTGGKADGDRTTEAATARAYAIRRGVPAAAILAEDRSRTTLESIRGVSGLLHEHHLASRRVRVRPAAHAARPPDGPRRGHHGLRLADGDEPDRARPGGPIDAVVHELGALAVYFAGASSRPEAGRVDRRTSDSPSWR